MSIVHYTQPLEIDNGNHVDSGKPSMPPFGFTRDLFGVSIQQVGLAIGFIALGATLGAGLTAGHVTLNLLSAASAASSALYFAALSGAKNIRDFLAMIVPAATILGLLVYGYNDSTLVGFSLFTHAATTFYGTLNRPRNAISEMNLWPILLGYHWALLIAWAMA